MRLRLAALMESLRSSLFFVPTLFLLAGIGLGMGMLLADRAITDISWDLPFALTSTVDSARTVLSTIAGATITVAGIAFSVSLLIIQLASSQYSPRVVHGLFRDPFNRRVIGIVVGVFTYCLVVLRSVRGPIDDGGDPVIPNLSVTLALLLGFVAILAIVGFIDHSAHSMDVSQILQRITQLSLKQARGSWRDEPGVGHSAHALRPLAGDAEGYAVQFDRNGWIQQLDVGRLVKLAPPGGTIRFDSHVGRYAVAGTVMCTIWPAPDDLAGVTKAANRAVEIGDTRTTQQDQGYGLRQLADVALKALSPGVNDPTTAQDAMYHAAAVLGELLRRHPTRLVEQDGRRLLLANQYTAEELVGLTFDEVRVAAASLPTVCVYLLEIIALMIDSLERDDEAGAVEPLRTQARLVLAGAEAADLLDHDKARVREAYRRRFAVSGLS